jgi:peptidoglycan/xylan/chitin deacetylase (PgdA/CDA1 family)
MEPSAGKPHQRVGQGLCEMKNALRRLVLHGIGHLSGHWPGHGVAVLCLHSIRPSGARRDGFEPLRELAVSASFLEELILELQRRGFDIVSLAEAVSPERRHSARRAVAFTLDDGYADNFTRAYPIFRRHSVPFAVFLTTGFIDRSVLMWWLVAEALVRQRECVILPDQRGLTTRTARQKRAAFGVISGIAMCMTPDRLAAFINALLQANPGTSARETAMAAPLSWNDVRTMAASGLATFGCHTVCHAPLALLDPDGCTGEIAGARDRIGEELGTHPRFFAYPYGGLHQIGTEAPRLVAAAGFEAAFTTRCEPVASLSRDSAYTLPRVVIRAEDMLAARAYVSGLPSAIRSTPKRLFRSAFAPARVAPLN